MAQEVQRQILLNDIRFNQMYGYYYDQASAEEIPKNVVYELEAKAQQLGELAQDGQDAPILVPQFKLDKTIREKMEYLAQHKGEWVLLQYGSDIISLSHDTLILQTTFSYDSKKVQYLLESDCITFVLLGEQYNLEVGAMQDDKITILRHRKPERTLLRNRDRQITAPDGLLDMAAAG